MGAHMRKKKNKTWMKSIIILLFCFMAVAILVKYFVMNTHDKNTLVARDAEETIVQLAELGKENGYKNALAELTVKQITEIGGDKYYRLQQNYKGIPVYGKTVVYVTDQDDNAMSVTGNIVDVDENISLIPTVTQEQINLSLKAWLVNKMSISDTEIKEISNGGLCIYISSMTGNSHLAYRIYVGIYEIIVDAHNAEILSMTATVVPETESVTGYMASDNENLNGFAIKKLGKYYYVMSDISRGLTVYTFNGRISQDDTRFWRSRATIVESTDQIFGNTEAEIALEYEEGAQLLLNVAQIYDYFKVLGFTFTGQNTNLYYNDGYDDGENALGGRVDGCGIISMGAVTGVNCIDVIAHEYAHFVSRKLVEWEGNPESGALNEAISDIFGELVESYVTSTEVNWMMDDFRNIAQPSEFQNPDFYGGEYWGDTSNPIKDNDYGYVHNNSTVISHAAYLMWNGIDGDDTKRIPADNLAKLWYRAMLMMPADCDFSTCRQLVEWAALSVDGLTELQRECIAEAFDMVGIYDMESSPQILVDCDRNVHRNSVLNVYNKESKLHSKYTVHITGTIAEHELAYSTNILNDSAYYYETTESINTARSYHLNLPDGYYTFIVTDQYNPQLEYMFTVSVSEKGTEDIINLYTNFEEQLIINMGQTLTESSSDNESNETESIVETVESWTGLHCEWVASGDFDDDGSDEIYALVCIS